MKSARISLPLVLAALALACDDGLTSSGTGTVAFTTWGEEYIEEELPASEFADGWSVKFDKFLVTLSQVRVASGDTVGAEMSGQKVFDMVRPGVKRVWQTELAARPWESVGFVVGPAQAGAEAGEASAEDVARLVQGGLSVYVEGTGTKGEERKHFAWGFTENTLYESCRGAIAGKETDGVLVTQGGTDTAQITIHGDHLFYDDLASADAELRFANVAKADADADGEVTLDELAALPQSDLALEGGSYGVGGFSDVLTYKDFVTALTRTLAHFRGEGECVSRRR